MIEDNSRAWLEIDLDALRHNTQEIRKYTSSQAEIIGVVKADGYGHGAVEVSRCILENGVTRLAVSQLDEAIQLRQHGITAPILLLSDLEPERVEGLLAYDVAQIVFTRAFAETISRKAVETGKTAKIHIKLDTGMGRVGFQAEDPHTIEEILAIGELPGLCIEGIFTHFAVSDEAGETEVAYTKRQFALFEQVCDTLAQRGLRIPFRHVANSAAILRYPEMHLEGVRAGIILYGLHPSACTEQSISLRPAMTFKARLTSVKRVPAGTSLSYGCTFTTQRESVIATVPVGYADGYFRALSNKARVLIGGQYAPICGRVCMDQFMVDVTDIVAGGQDVLVGDEVVLMGRQGDLEISAEELAALCDTIHYEIICSPGKRVPKRYVAGGKTVGVMNVLIG